MFHPILVHISGVNLEENGTKVETVRYCPVNLVGQDSPKIEYSKVSSLLVYSGFKYFNK